MLFSLLMKLVKSSPLWHVCIFSMIQAFSNSTYGTLISLKLIFVTLIQPAWKWCYNSRRWGNGLCRSWDSWWHWDSSSRWLRFLLHGSPEAHGGEKMLSIFIFPHCAVAESAWQSLQETEMHRAFILFIKNNRNCTLFCVLGLRCGAQGWLMDLTTSISRYSCRKSAISSCLATVRQQLLEGVLDV